MDPVDRPGRAVLGIAGAPAAGKSMLAALLVAELEQRRPGAVVGVGMDACHIGHRVLLRRGLTEVKGAPETFDAVGCIHLLHRIRTEQGTVYSPKFDRDIEESLAHVVEIGSQVGLVVTEGNYGPNGLMWAANLQGLP
jgi:pantothenate kinase